MHTEDIEKRLRQDKDRLAKEADNARLDLADSLASRRELQKHVEFYRAELLKITNDYDSLRVFTAPLHLNEGKHFANSTLRSAIHTSPFLLTAMASLYLVTSPS